MKRKPQIAWAIVRLQNGWINQGMIRFTRRDVIADWVALHRGYRVYEKLEGLTDRQFWRILKRRRGLSVRRISLRVIK